MQSYFNGSEIKMLLTTYFYSTLYYNSEIWLSNNLNLNSKQTIFSASSKPLYLTRPLGTNVLSFKELSKKNSLNFYQFELPPSISPSPGSSQAQIDDVKRL